MGPEIRSPNRRPADPRRGRSGRQDQTTQRENRPCFGAETHITNATDPTRGRRIQRRDPHRVNPITRPVRRGRNRLVRALTIAFAVGGKNHDECFRGGILQCERMTAASIRPVMSPAVAATSRSGAGPRRPCRSAGTRHRLGPAVSGCGRECSVNSRADRGCVPNAGVRARRQHIGFRRPAMSSRSGPSPMRMTLTARTSTHARSRGLYVPVPQRWR
jgi:hypothetical protein